jgi:hypothetical protein
MAKQDLTKVQWTVVWGGFLLVVALSAYDLILSWPLT